MKDIATRTYNERLEILNELLYDKELHQVKEWIVRTNFLSAPASRKYHGAYASGLFDHSAKVAVTLLELTERNNLKWLKERSPILVGIAHDFCKFDKYLWDEEAQKFVHNPNLEDDRHGDRSVDILKTLIPDLTEEEILCIKYHMGFTLPQEDWEGFMEAIRKYPNVLWTHQADMISTFIYNT